MNVECLIFMYIKMVQNFITVCTNCIIYPLSIPLNLFQVAGGVRVGGCHQSSGERSRERVSMCISHISSHYMECNTIQWMFVH